jgi:hypothetical protein
MKPTIKAYVGYSERSNTHFYQNFEIVSSIPSVGDEFDGLAVEDITPVVLDCEQGSDRVYDYDYYEINMADPVGDFHDTLYWAVKKEEEAEVVATRENFETFAGAETTDHIITVAQDDGNYFKSVSAAEWLSFCEDCARNLIEMEWTASERDDWEDEYGVYGYTADKIAELMEETAGDGDDE